MNLARQLLLTGAVFAVGAGLGIAFHYPALQNEAIYVADSLQSPHWAAYPVDSFRDDDLILRYARFNESPLQNAIYRIVTRGVEYPAAGKLLGVGSYGLLAAFAFLVGRAMSGVRFGLLLALFLVLLPDHWSFSVGFFSKFWAIPLLLACVWVLRSGKFAWLLALLPFSAVAYPTTAASIGLTATVFALLTWRRDRNAAWKLLRWLAAGSLVALATLTPKYLSPPEEFGEQRPGAELREMDEVRQGGYPSRYVPVPSWTTALLEPCDRPLFLLDVGLFFAVLGRRRVAWERSWTALLVASAVGYIAADLLFFHLYVPNRYTRYSLAVLIALWNATNWERVLDALRSNRARWGALACLIGAGVVLERDAWKQPRELSDRSAIAPAARFVRTQLPGDVLIAGAPRYLDDLMLQGKRSVLAPYRLAHPWYTGYYDEIRERTRASLRAHLAADVAAIDELHRRYGVTHFLIDKDLLRRARRGERVFTEPLGGELAAEIGDRRTFLLDALPPGIPVWNDVGFAIVELPLAARLAPNGEPPPRGGADSR